MRTAQRRTTERGFTLLEVLVATAIMGITVAGIMNGLATASRNVSRLTQYDRAGILARSKMDELLEDNTLKRNTPIQGMFTPQATGGVEAGWKAQLTPFETMTAGGGGYWLVERIALEIWWMDGPTRRSFALDGYRRGTAQGAQ